LNQKNVALEKIKMRLTGELDDMHVEVERATVLANQMEKRGKNFDKVVSEWKAKVDDLAAELDASQKECRNYSTELFRLKAGYDESQEHLEAVRRENKNLADEIKDLMDQIGEGGRNVHEIDKQRKRLEVEKEELQAALEEAESALEQEENKVSLNYLKFLIIRNPHHFLPSFRYFVLSWNFLKCARKSTAASRRRKKNSKTPARITNAPSTRCRPAWKPKPRAKPRHSA
jgi:hypothetical protein